MEAIISLSEFMEANEQHMTSILVYCLAVFGGLGFSLSLFFDFGALLYCFVRESFLALRRKAKK